MRRTARTTLPALGLLLLGASAAQAQFTAYGLGFAPGGVPQLVRFDSGNPGAVTVVGVTRVEGGNFVELDGIDFRPSNNVLYGYSSDRSQLYTINLSTGAATPLFGVGSATSLPVGFDFNPVADALRITGSAGQNLRILPNTGVTNVDVSLAYAAGDPNGAGAPPRVTGVAYTNNDNDPATGTLLYGIDEARGTLVTINPANSGTLATVGSLGLGSTVQVSGFDIVTVGGVNSAFFATRSGTGISNFYRLDLTTGASALVGTVGSLGGIRGLAFAPVAAAVVPEPGTWALLATGLVGVGAVAARRRRADG